jgi:argininosuccinate synthase
VIDIREEFARGYLLPAIQPGTPISEAAIGALAAECVTTKLQQIAELEGDAEVNAPSFIPVTRVAAVRSLGIDRGADVEISFESGTPVAISRVPMSVFELIECLNTIGAAHGVADAQPGVRLLQCGYQALNPAGTASSGVVRLEINQGRVVAARTDYATT